MSRGRRRVAKQFTNRYGLYMLAAIMVIGVAMLGAWILHVGSPDTGQEETGELRAS